MAYTLNKEHVRAMKLWRYKVYKCAFPLSPMFIFEAKCNSFDTLTEEKCQSKYNGRGKERHLENLPLH